MKIAPIALTGLMLFGLAACNDADSLPPSAKYATVKGVVLDAVTQQPIAGATVVVDVAFTTQTAADGSFSISNVPAGDVDYTVQASGYRNLQDSKRVDPAATLSLTLQLSH
ncbi:MAG: hypothetical protein DLM50_09795 [Candidatus Meridianibacter frigidus]|nr:MAG: hypothetical protein DLM50_09795 [Candidatus Eremiobacteraeota bacterium]